jgi:transketolase
MWMPLKLLCAIVRFGASAPGEVVLKNLGFDVDTVLDHARALLARS